VVAEEDAVRCDAKFAALGAPPDPRPPDALRDHLELVPHGGGALDVACGAGAHAVWLAARGMRVDAVDISTEALRLGSELAARHGVADRVRWLHRDLDEGLPAETGGPYELVLCQRFRDRALYRPLVERLAPGGLLVVTVLSEVGGRPGRFRAAPGELAVAFGDLELLVDVEGGGEASVVARRPVAG
jgi:SAM-dependent methyltransferase